MLVLDDAVAGAPLVLVGGCFTVADFVAVATAGGVASGGAEVKIFPLRLANCSGVRSFSLSTKF